MGLLAWNYLFPVDVSALGNSRVLYGREEASRAARQDCGRGTWDSHYHYKEG